MTFLVDALPIVMELLAVSLLVTSYFAALTLWQTARTLNTRWVIETADHVIETVVRSLMQSVADDLKVKPSAKPPGGSSSGRLTPEEADQIKRVAVNRARELLGEPSIRKLNNLFNNVDLYLSDRIEHFVRASRNA